MAENEDGQERSEQATPKRQEEARRKGQVPRSRELTTMAMLLMAADRTEGLLKEPKPFVLQQALADFAVNYELNAYCSNEKQAVSLYSELHRNIQDVFNEYGVQIMTPAYEKDTPEPKIVPKDQWYSQPASPPTQNGQASQTNQQQCAGFGNG